VTRGGPQLQLRIAGRAQLQQVVVAAVVQLKAADRLRVAAIEALGEAQDGRQRPHRAARTPPQIGEAVVFPFRRALPVIAGDQRDGLDFIRLEAAQIAVLDEIVRVLVMPLVADVHADVVKDGGVLQPLALTIGQAVDGARLIEEADG
jgi:hypothetical protein